MKIKLNLEIDLTELEEWNIRPFTEKQIKLIEEFLNEATIIYALKAYIYGNSDFEDAE